MSADEIAIASSEELRIRVGELQAAMHEAKMSAAHHKLQYQMLAKESAAAIERMAVEARMAQYENDVIHVAEQAKVAATPVQPLPALEGMIPVQKDLYQSMCCEIQHLSEVNNHLQVEHSQHEKIITKQESEIASLSDKVILMRERIRENREHLSKMRQANAASHIDSTPRSVYTTPDRSHGHQDQTQPFAALLQASEMASQEARRPVPGAKRGHTRNTHSLSSLPATPARFVQKPHTQSVYQTPLGRQLPMKVPSTAPMPRTSLKRASDVYAQSALPVTQARGPGSEEGTVSASEHDDDSEAETDILEPEEGDEVSESQASRAASQMLRASQDSQVKRDSFKGSGMLGQQSTAADARAMKQTKLFGAVRKANADRSGDEPPAKKARTAEPTQPRPVGLGIAGVRD